MDKISTDNQPTDRAPNTYPGNDVTAEQVESLIASTANLQMQVLRKFAKAALEEMHYHLWVAQEKCRMHEETIARLEKELADTKAAEKDALVSDLASMVRRMSYAIAHSDNKHPLIKQSVDFLKRHNLGGNILRAES